MSQNQQERIEAIDRELISMTEEKLRVNPRLQYGEALKLVASEHPNLDKRRTRLFRGEE